MSANSFDWKVPALERNSTRCLLKIIGYDVSGQKIGADISDSKFTIEVSKLTSLNGGQTLTASTSTTITWTTHSTVRPVASVKLKYTVNGGRTWKLMDTVSGNPGSYSWQLPAVPKMKSKCRVAVILKDADGKTVGTDGSDAYFTIQP